MRTIYTATVRVAGGRGGTATSLTGSFTTALTRPAERGADRTDVNGSDVNGTDVNGTDPEELFAAGYAACFDSALGVAARRERITLGAVTVTASVSLRATDDGRYAIAVALTVTAPDCPQSDLERAVAAADLLCPYSNPIRGNTPVTIQIDGVRS
jgi:Ohr subfamily peroxiredoxin